MKKTILILIIFFSSIHLFGQNISGLWKGTVNIHDREVRIVFNITKDGKRFNATMDSPDYGVRGISASYLSIKDSVLTLRILDVNTEFVGNLSVENSIIGVLKQSDELFPLVLRKDNSRIAENLKY